VLSDGKFEICAPSVVGEVIDGEAIVMDLRSGAYYSTDGLGGAIWQAIDAGATRQQILGWAGAVLGDQAPVAAFLDDLLARDLVRVTTGNGSLATLPVLAGPYASPVLSVHEDMQDLIQLDPIHDVDEMGWPKRKVDV
jgi:hypothetical protein